MTNKKLTDTNPVNLRCGKLLQRKTTDTIFILAFFFDTSVTGEKIQIRGWQETGSFSSFALTINSRWLLYLYLYL